MQFFTSRHFDAFSNFCSCELRTFFGCPLAYSCKKTDEAFLIRTFPDLVNSLRHSIVELVRISNQKRQKKLIVEVGIVQRQKAINSTILCSTPKRPSEVIQILSCHKCKAQHVFVLKLTSVADDSGALNDVNSVELNKPELTLHRHITITSITIITIFTIIADIAVITSQSPMSQSPRQSSHQSPHTTTIIVSQPPQIFTSQSSPVIMPQRSSHHNHDSHHIISHSSHQSHYVRFIVNHSRHIAVITTEPPHQSHRKSQ